MPSAKELTGAVAELGPLLKSSGFRRFGVTFNRQTEPGLIHVVAFQGQQSGGTFTVNLGVYVREVDQLFDDWWGRSKKTGKPGEGRRGAGVCLLA